MGQKETKEETGYPRRSEGCPVMGPEMGVADVGMLIPRLTSTSQFTTTNHNTVSNRFDIGAIPSRPTILPLSIFNH
jgi:hypothetical protein